MSTDSWRTTWILKERQLSIASMLDLIRRRLMMKFAENKEMSRNWNSMLCPTYEKKLAGNIESFRTMKLIRSTNVVFEVLSLDENFRVDGFCVRAIFSKLMVFLILILWLPLVALKYHCMTTFINFSYLLHSGFLIVSLYSLY